MEMIEELATRPSGSLHNASRPWHGTTRGRLVAVSWALAVAVAFAGTLGGSGHWELLGLSFLVVGGLCLLGTALAPRWSWVGIAAPVVACALLALIPLRPLEADGGSIACFVLAGLSLGLGVALSRGRWVPWAAVCAAVALGSSIFLGHAWFSEVFGAKDARDIMAAAAPGEVIEMSPHELQDPVWGMELFSSNPPLLLFLHIAAYLGVVLLGLAARWTLLGRPLSAWALTRTRRGRRAISLAWFLSVSFAALAVIPLSLGNPLSWLYPLPLLGALALAPFFPRAVAWALAVMLVVTGIGGLPESMLLPYDSLPLLAPVVLLTAAIVAARLAPGRNRWFVLGALWLAGTAWWACFDNGYGALRGPLYTEWYVSDVKLVGTAKGIAVGGFWQALAIFAGLGVHTWISAIRGRIDLATARRELAASEQDRARQDERRGIAGDVHDVLAHSLTVIVAQGEGALVSQGTEQQDAVRRMVDVARASLRDVRALIERLDGEDTDLPSPGLENLPALLQNVRDAGLCLETEEFGERLPLGDSTELALYRILQEALTNVLTHGGRGSTARLVLDWRGEDPGLTVTLASTTAPGAEPRPGTGLGLEGMRTRAAVAGGWLTAGPDDASAGPGGTPASATTHDGAADAGSGWLVTAHLPAVAESAAVLR